jgi:hypothetical protein
MARIVFWSLMSLNAAAWGLCLVLGLAAAKPSHTPVLQVLVLFAVPALLLAAVAALHLLGPWPWARTVATALAGLPLLLLLGAVATSGFWAWRSGALEAAVGAASQARAPASSPQQPPAETLEAAIRDSRETGVGPVREMLQAGAQPKQRSASQPAWFAALSPAIDLAVLTLLLDQGADLQARDAAGRTAVQVAAAQRHWAGLAVLIERGAAWQQVQMSDGQSLRQRVMHERRRTPAGSPEAAALARLWQAMNQE